MMTNKAWLGIDCYGRSTRYWVCGSAPTLHVRRMKMAKTAAKKPAAKKPAAKKKKK